MVMLEMAMMTVTVRGSFPILVKFRSFVGLVLFLWGRFFIVDVGVQCDAIEEYLDSSRTLKGGKL